MRKGRGREGCEHTLPPSHGGLLGTARRCNGGAPCLVPISSSENSSELNVSAASQQRSTRKEDDSNLCAVPMPVVLEVTTSPPEPCATASSAGLLMRGRNTAGASGATAPKATTPTTSNNDGAYFTDDLRRRPSGQSPAMRVTKSAPHDSSIADKGSSRCCTNALGRNPASASSEPTVNALAPPPLRRKHLAPPVSHLSSLSSSRTDTGTPPRSLDELSHVLNDNRARSRGLAPCKHCRSPHVDRHASHGLSKGTRALTSSAATRNSRASMRPHSYSSFRPYTESSAGSSNRTFSQSEKDDVLVNTEAYCRCRRSCSVTSGSSASENDEDDSSSSSSSTSELPVCIFTDVLPRDIYLLICSFLSEMDCCTLLEVSLSMHAAITSADGHVWRQLCMSTWMYKQGFQTFMYRMRAMEKLARQEEREVLALQQHLLLLREQDMAIGESDLSATCDCATVLIRRRLHERAQWMAAGASCEVPPAAHQLAFYGSRLGANVGSATTSASSTTQSDDDISSDGRGGSSRNRSKSGRSRKHRSNAATKSSSGRSKRRTSVDLERSRTAPARSSKCKVASNSEHIHRSSRDQQGVITRISQRKYCSHASPCASSSKISTAPPAAGQDLSSSQSTRLTHPTRGNRTAVCQLPVAGAYTHIGSINAQGGGQCSPLPATVQPVSHPPSEPARGSREDCSDVCTSGAEEGLREVEKTQRRVRIQFLEAHSAGDDDATLTDTSVVAVRSGSMGRCPPRSHRQSTRNNSFSSNSSSPVSVSRNHYRRHEDLSSQQQNHQRSQPPGSRHRRSRSIKRRKSARQRRRKRGRSRGPRSTGGGGGRHRVHHHRSQSRHHRSSHQHHHNPKATKSTRRRRRRQRNAAAAAAAAEVDVDGGGGAYFYQTVTYEAIKSTTPVLAAQHVAPCAAPQLRMRPSHSGESCTCLVAPTARGCDVRQHRNLSRQRHGGSGRVANPTDAHGSSPGTALLRHGNGDNDELPAMSRASGTQLYLNSATVQAASSSDTVPTTATATNTEAASRTDPGLNGLYWWQLAPETRQRQLRRMQQQQSTSRRFIMAPSSQTLDDEERADEEALREWDELEASSLELPFDFSDSIEDGNLESDESEDTDSSEFDQPPGESDGLDEEINASDPASGDEETSRSDEVGERQKRKARHCSSWRGHADGEPRNRGRSTAAGACNCPASPHRGNALERRHPFPRVLTASPSLATNMQLISTENIGDGLAAGEANGAVKQQSEGGRGRCGSSVEMSCGGAANRDENSDAFVSLESQKNRSGCGMLTRQRTRRRGNNNACSRAASALSMPSASSSRFSRRAERRTAKELAKRFEAIEEAMVITHSKSVLIRTLERQTYAHLPRLLATAAQRQRRLTLIKTRPASSGILAAATQLADSSSLTLADPSTARRPDVPENVLAVPPARTGLQICNANPDSTGDGNRMQPFPTLLSSTASLLPSSLNNSFAALAGSSVTVLASPLHPLLRIASSRALAPAEGDMDNGRIDVTTDQERMRPLQSPPNSDDPVAALLDRESTTAPRLAVSRSVGVDSQMPFQSLFDQQRSTRATAVSNAESRSEAMANTLVSRSIEEDTVDDDVPEDEDEPEEEFLAPVSWKFAFFMSRREARRACVTLQDLLEGMWAVCFRSTGRTHPIHFTRQHQLFVYPPLLTTEEEEQRLWRRLSADTNANGSDDSSTFVTPQNSSVVAGTRSSASAQLPAFPAAAPPLPFHILQGGAQLVVHQFPPMKVARRNTASLTATSPSGVAAVAPVAAVDAETGPIGTPSTFSNLATTADQRFAAEPHETLRKLRLRLLDFDKAGRAQRGEMQRSSSLPLDVEHALHIDSLYNVRCGTNDVRRLIAQQLGFHNSYITEVLGSTATVPQTVVESSGGVERAPPSEAANSLQIRSGPVSPAHKRCIGPLTLEEFEAQQRREALFRSNGLGDVHNDWGWSITSHRVKIFSLDVMAPLYIEQLQRMSDVEISGNCNGGERCALSA